jgi:hypothetical protein
MAYVSRATKPISARDLLSIQTTSMPTNMLRGVTSLLCYSGGYFGQVLEGRDDVLGLTIGRIISDPRHEILDMFHRERIDERLMAGCVMAVADLGSQAWGCRFSGAPAARLLDQMLHTPGLERPAFRGLRENMRVERQRLLAASPESSVLDAPNDAFEPCGRAHRVALEEPVDDVG